VNVIARREPAAGDDNHRLHEPSREPRRAPRRQAAVIVVVEGTPAAPTEPCSGWHDDETVRLDDVVWPEATRGGSVTAGVGAVRQSTIG
jgi:hypothetical protein